MLYVSIPANIHMISFFFRTLAFNESLDVEYSKGSYSLEVGKGNYSLHYLREQGNFQINHGTETTFKLGGTYSVMIFDTVNRSYCFSY